MSINYGKQGLLPGRVTREGEEGEALIISTIFLLISSDGRAPGNSNEWDMSFSHQPVAGRSSGVQSTPLPMLSHIHGPELALKARGTHGHPRLLFLGFAVPTLPQFPVITGEITTTRVPHGFLRVFISSGTMSWQC